MKRFIIKFIFYSLIVILISGITIKLSIYLKPDIFKGSYAEYLMWEYQKNIIKKKENNKNIIVGDSRALAGIDPRILGKNFINLGLGGSTPIEGYYTLKKILNSKHIDTLIIAYGEYHYLECDQFKSRTLAFNFINESELEEIEKIEKKFNKSIDGEALNFKTKLERRTILEGFPFPYFQSTYISNLKTFLTTKIKPHEEMMQHNGHVLFGRADSANGLAVETSIPSFEAHEVIDCYLDSLISLAINKNLYVILTNIPINKNTFRELERKKFNESFQKYLKSKKLKFEQPKLRVLINNGYFENRYFGDDAGHLNKKGSDLYSKILRDSF